MVSKRLTSAQRFKCNQASRGSEQKKTDKDRATDLRSRSRSLNKQSLAYATGNQRSLSYSNAAGNQMVTNSSAVPNTSTVLKTTLKSIGPFIIKILDFEQYVKRLDGRNASLKCLGKVIAIECNLDQAVSLHDIMDCAEEQLSVYNSSPSIFSDVIVSTTLFTFDGKAKLVGVEKVNLHESILCALSLNSSLCSDIFNRIKWKPWWCKFMLIAMVLTM